MAKRTSRKNTPKVAPELKRRFEDVRNTYLTAVAAYDVLNAERTALISKLDPTGELCFDWYENDTEPIEVTNIEFECSQAMSLRTTARNLMIDVAEELTGVLAANYRIDINELPRLFEHLRMRPFSQNSQKVIDIILRLEVR